MTSVFKSWTKGSILITDAGWGDSGKGKVVSAFSPKIGAKIIGGHNAGHTIVTDKGEFGLGLVPSTIISPKTFNIIGQEVVINPLFLIEEIKSLNKGGIAVSPKNLMIDLRSHLVTPWHSIRDALSEEARGKAAIGSLHLGVGWTFSDRINRRGLRFTDLFAKDWKARVKKEFKNQLGVIDDAKLEVKRKTGKKSKLERKLKLSEIIKIASQTRRFLAPFIGNTLEVVWKEIDMGSKILFEDSHGAMLDVSHGSWPFTTGVNTGVGAVQRSFGGKAVRSLVRIITASKAYQTRVGGGPMPTEDFGEFGKYVRTKGGEVGTRSGRARRCGAFDIPLVSYGLNAIGAGKVDEIALTKLDVLTGWPKIPVCVGYLYKGKLYKETPRVDALFLSQVKPKLVYLPGWKEDLTKIRKFKNLPKAAQNYVLYLEKHLGRRITFIGVGKHKDSYILNG